MLEIITASEQSTLLTVFAKHLRQNNHTLFMPTYVVSAGYMQDLWLKEHLAEENGIVANLKMLSPDRFMEWLVFRLGRNQAAEQLSLQQLEWVYFSLMGSGDFQYQFADMAAYFGTDEVKRLALAQKAVRLLDKYQDFRPAMIQQWRNDNNLASNDWQEYLFVHALALLGEQLPDKSSWVPRIRALLKDNEKQIWFQEHLPHVYLFGSFTITPKFLELIEVLEPHTQLHWYRVNLLVNDNAHYLLKNWGMHMQQLRLAIADKLLFADDPYSKRFENPPSNMLQHVQKALFDNEIFNLDQQALATDSSIEFHSCHNKLREVESLYNYLLRMLEQQKELGARDIMVLIPGLDAYIAPIRTVFDTAPKELPYRIVGGANAEEENFFSVLLKLLAFDAQQFTGVGLTELIETAPLQQSFGFEDPELIRKMMSLANMARDFEGSNETETRYASFQYGLKRLMHGFLLGMDDLHFTDADGELVFTVDVAEGQQAADLIRLLDFTHKLHNLVNEKQNPRPLPSWLEWVAELASNFLDPDPLQSKKFQQLLQQFGRVGEFVQEEISFQTFLFQFESALQEIDKHAIQGFGGIIFAELFPGRVLPKKVIALLGLDFGAFPRIAKPLSFDKMATAETRHPLDPNPRLSDQHSFLEAILSAQMGLYLSFKGQNDTENKILPASPMVEELMEWLASPAELKAAQLRISHPLHSYDARYNRDDNPKLKNYLLSQHEGYDFGEAEALEYPAPTEVELKHVSNFFQNALKYYYNQVLGIYYDDQQNQLNEKELIELGNLEQWKINDLVLQRTGEVDDETRLELIAKGMLPLREQGKTILQDAQNIIAGVQLAYQNLLPLNATSLQLDMGGFSLTGTLTFNGRNEMVFATVSKNKAKYRMKAALEYLFGRALGYEKLHYLTLDKNEVWNFDISQQDAREKLSQLVKMYADNKNTKYLMTLDIDFTSALTMQDQNDRIKKATELIDKYMNPTHKDAFVETYLKKENEAGVFDEQQQVNQLLQNVQELKKILTPINV